MSAIFLSQTENEILAISISMSVLISALMFFGVCIYHVVKTIQKVRPKVAEYMRKLCEAKRKNQDSETDHDNELHQIFKPQCTSTVLELDHHSEPLVEQLASQYPQKLIAVDYSKYREELLDSTD